MAELVAPTYFDQLAALDPREVCRRTACRFDAAQAQYLLSLWGHRYEVNPGGHTIRCDAPVPLHPYFDLFAIYFLIHAAPCTPSGRWISEKEIPGGVTFFRGPHEIPTTPIVSRMQGDIDRFSDRCRQCHGTPLGMADAAFVFFITETIPVAVLFWKGDEDFPAEITLLYDATITAHLTTDIVYALAVGVCDRLSRPLTMAPENGT